MKKILPAFMALSLSAAAQQDYQKFEWNPRPTLHTISSADANEAAVMLADDKMVEYVIEKNGVSQYRTTHRLVHINTDKGVEGFNRVYLPFDEGMEVMEVKARTILNNNRVINLDRSNIKEVQEDNRTYKIFAIEGLTTNCEVEYYYTVRRNPNFFGREIFSYKVPLQSGSFQLICPEKLKFDLRSYNDLPAASDSVAGGKRFATIRIPSLKSEPEERYSMDDAASMRVEYKLSYNLAKPGNERMFTWDELARRVHSNYKQLTDKEKRAVRDLVGQSKAGQGLTERERVHRLEQYLKKNLNIRDDISGDDADNLATVIKTKNCSESAISKLFCAALAELNIPFEMVLTGDRSDYVIDKKLENWNNARHVLLYFPSFKKYLAPSETAYRMPWFPPNWGATTGLFVVTTQLGNIESAFAEFRQIPLEESKSNFHDLQITAVLDKTMDTLIVDTRQRFGGYSAVTYRSPFLFASADQHFEIVKQFVSFGTKSEQVRKYELENADPDQADPMAPFTIKATVHSGELLEKAGSKIIVKVGDLIGEQAQLYNEKERRTNIDVGYAHGLHRTIELKIPAGYSVRNLKDLEMNHVYKEGDVVKFNFSSRYELKGDILYIYVDENYNDYIYPKNLFAAFQKVINAAADFNKVALVLEKK